MSEKIVIGEQDLIELIQKQDRNAFFCAYDKFSSPLYGVICKLVKDQPLAELVLKKSFDRMWQQSQTLANYNGRLFIWMHNITRNVAIEELNKAIRSEVKQQRYNNLGGNLA